MLTSFVLISKIIFVYLFFYIKKNPLAISNMSAEVSNKRTNSINKKLLSAAELVPK
jgi:hypothetical protein